MNKKLAQKIKDEISFYEYSPGALEELELKIRLIVEHIDNQGKENDK